MILGQTTVSGIGTPFRDRTITIDWQALGSGLIAITGLNGAGKTTLLECSATLPLYLRSVCYNVSLRDLIAPGVRDARLEHRFTLGGRAYTIHVACDPQYGGRGRLEHYLATAGAAYGPNQADVAQALATVIPTLDFLSASVFAGQGRRGAERSLFAMDRRDRRALFAEMLGLAHMQAYSAAAGERHKACVDDVDHAREDVARARQRGEQYAMFTGQLHTHEDTLAKATSHASDAAAVFQAAREAVTACERDAAVATAKRDGIRQRNAERRDRARTVEDQRTAVLNELAALEELLAEGPAITAAVAAVREAEAIMDARGRVLEGLSEVRRPLAEDLARLCGEQEEAKATFRGVKAELDRALEATAALADVGDLEAEATRLEEERAIQARWCEHLDVEVVAAVAAHTEALEAAGAIRGHEVMLTQLRPQAAVLASLEDPTNPMCVRCPAVAVAQQAAQAQRDLEAGARALPYALAADLEPRKERRELTEAAARGARKGLHEAGEAILALAERRRGLAALVEAARPLEALQARRDAITTEGSARRARIEDLELRVTGLDGQIANARGERQVAQATREKHVVRARAGEALALADTRQATAERRLAELNEEYRTLRDEEPEPPLPATDLLAEAQSILAEGTVRHRNAQTIREEAAALVERCRGGIASLGDPAAELADLERAIAGYERDAADWHHLEAALGPDGLQALEIELAGPNVTALANDLLTHCYGPRFAIAIETVAEKKSGGQKDVFENRVLDGLTGRVGTEGSPGEMVILDEAVRLALAIYNTQRSGFELRTLWRDEVTGPLDTENADHYLAMLRRAMQLGGFHQVIFICHQPELADAADVRIHVKDGAVTFDPPVNQEGAGKNLPAPSIIQEGERA